MRILKIGLPHGRQRADGAGRTGRPARFAVRRGAGRVARGPRRPFPSRAPPGFVAFAQVSSPYQTPAGNRVASRVMPDSILVTGGAGFVGSHIVVELGAQRLCAGRARQLRQQHAGDSLAPGGGCGSAGALRDRRRPGHRRGAQRLPRLPDRRRHSLRGTQELAGVGGARRSPITTSTSAGTLALVEVMGEAGVGHPGVQLVRRRRTATPAISRRIRGCAVRAGKRLRAHEARRRGSSARPVAGQCELALRHRAQVQRRGCAFVGDDGRGAPHAVDASDPAAVSRRGRRGGRDRRQRRRLGHRRTEPAYAITCTSRTSPTASCGRCGTSRPGPGSLTVNLGSGNRIRCSASLPRSSAPAEEPFRAWSGRVAPATSPRARRTSRTRSDCWAGARRATSTPSVPMPGGGRRTGGRY